MRRYTALVLLGLGTLLGYASGFHSVRHARAHGHWHAPCYLDGGSWLSGY